MSPAHLDAFYGQARPAPAASWFVRACLTLFAFGLAMDSMVGTKLGSAGQQSLVTSVVLAAPLVIPAGWHLVIGKGIRPVPPSFLAMATFVAWCALSVLWVTSDNTSTLVAVTTRVQLLIFVWLGYQMLRSSGDLRPMMAGYVLGCCVLVVLTWRNYLQGIYVSWDRYAADGFDPNDMAMYLALGIPMVAYLAVSGPPGRHLRKLSLLYVPFALSGIVLSGSRGGIIATVAVLVAVTLWLAHRNITALVLTAMLVGSAATLALPWIPPGTLDRIFSAREEFGAGAERGGRTEIWNAGLAAFPKHPIIGAGIGEFGDAALPYMNLKIVAHSTPLQIAVELGTVGLTFFFGAFVLAMWSMRRGGRNEKALVYCLIATLFIGMQGLSFDDRKPLWLVLLVAMVAGGFRPQPDSAGQE